MATRQTPTDGNDVGQLVIGQLKIKMTTVECCHTLKGLLEKYENPDIEVLENDFLIYATTVNEFSRQCKCLLKNPALIVPLGNLMKKYYLFCIQHMKHYVETKEWEHEFSLTNEILYQAVCKTFQLQYPIYQAYESVKNNFELTTEEKDSMQLYCDIAENSNASDLLFKNIAYYCENGGVAWLQKCFEVEGEQISLNLAGTLISIIAQIRVWLNDEAIVKLIKPLASPVSRYLCNMQEDDFRMMSARATAEVMLSTVKVQDPENLTCDVDILNIAFKFFMSSTLAVRMAGLNLITNQIHYLVELGQNQIYRNLSSSSSHLANWLNEKDIILHLFGPNYHVELIKQSLFLLNFLAKEKKLEPEHLDSIWNAAQLKHISRHVMDILITLAKMLDLESAQHLLEQIAKLPISSHTKQTLLLSSLLTRNIWSAGLSGKNELSEKKVHHTIPLKKPFLPKPIGLKQLNVSPIHSPYLSSDASTDDEVGDIHPQQFMRRNPAIAQLHGLDLKMGEPPIHSMLPTPASPLNSSCIVTSQESDLATEPDDGASSINTNCSTDQEMIDDLDEEVAMVTVSEATAAAAVASVPVSMDAVESEGVLEEFDVESLCEPGKTLLWDLIQDQQLGIHNEGLVDEAQKLLWQLICYSGNRTVRMVFIKGCLENIKQNRSVILSFKILPKILSMFPHSNNSADASKLLQWAVKDLNLMNCFFENLKEFISSWNEAQLCENEELAGDLELEIQARLDFLTAMFSNDITPDHFRLTIEQIDCLWSCLVTQLPDSYHFLILSWLLKQTNSEELHALGLDSFKHIFVKKLPELNAEKMTLTGLSLFQKLFGLTRLSNASPFTPEVESEESVLGTQQLWNIALKAERKHVANETMNILNHLYLAVGDSSVRKEQEFIKKCTSVLHEAVGHLEMNCLPSLRVIQQILKILRNHLESYSKRFAFHLEMWRLAGKNVQSHQCIRKNHNKDHVIKILCQPMGMSDKFTFKMQSSDLLAVFRARVTSWCINAVNKQDDAANKENFALLKPPFRLISHGHELTPDLDVKTLAELGVRDQQLVYISVANIRKDRLSNPSQYPASLQPAPNFESVPMIQLLKEDKFLQLFNFLEVLYRVSKMDDYKKLWADMVESKLDELSSLEDSTENVFDNPHELVKPLPVDVLLSNAWDLILLLPTNVVIRNRIVQGEFQSPEKWKQLLNLDQKFRLLYFLQILDGLTLPLLKATKDESVGDSSADSDSSLSDTDKSPSPFDRCSLQWVRKLFRTGMISQLLSLFLSDELAPNVDLDEWSLNALAYIIKILTRIGLLDVNYHEEKPAAEDVPSTSAVTEKEEDSRPQKKYVFRARYRSTEIENVVVIHHFNPLLMDTLDLLEENVLINRFISVLSYVSQDSPDSSNIGSQDVRASVVYHCLSFLVCWVSTRRPLRELLVANEAFSSLLIQIIFFSPQKSVRNEASRGIYKLCVSSDSTILNKVLNLLLGKLQELVSLKNALRLQTIQRIQQAEKIQSVSSSLSNYKDYFWLLCRLIGKYKEDGNQAEVINIRTAILQVSTFIQENDYDFCEGPPYVDHCLIGILQTCTALLQHDTDFKNSTQGYALMRDVFHKCLFNLPENYTDINNIRSRRETKSARQAAFELLLQLVSGCKDSYLELQSLLLRHHSLNKKTNVHSFYGWNYWPLEQERSNSGYVGLVNLGATCYMASCVQQLFMIPEARTAILETPIVTDIKHSGILREVQKMFAYLQLSIRKAYNPRSFCKTYSMDKQPLNTGEQKDMTEFFTDFVSKIEEMSPNLKTMTRGMLLGVITNNVLSLDCSHVSKTEEEFYFVRCTVADMKNLYESLDEVTVKDVLEGDNKYTCSQCDAKVRAEKRACFKSLPKVLCFNTMRYTFNMVTMMKEKVNTHFSFPMKLNMAAYTEEYLLKRGGEGDPDEIPGYWYNLVGVVVHTGTAEGGHYYSFIRDRTSKENCWYLFNDAEVKHFDPAQIAAECFGGEMTTKTFDAMTEKYMDFSFEKTHSAYMLFYEHCQLETENRLPDKISIPETLQEQIWDDNYQFLQDKLVFEPAYFNFVWQFCYNIPRTIKNDVLFHTVKLAASFLLETLVHSREKVQIKGWVDLLVHGFDRSQPACEWFLDHMAEDDWWFQQLFIRCPLQHIRQMFSQLCLMAVKNLRKNYVHLYSSRCEENCLCDENGGGAGSCSPITRFIKAMFLLLEENLRSYCKNVSELFGFLYQFLSLGHEECGFLLKMDGISRLVQFYNTLKSADTNETTCDDEDECCDLDDDEIITMLSTDEKFYPTALDKMIGSIALLLEEARDGTELHLSENDMKCFTPEKEFSFIYQITADVINLRQTAKIIFHLSCYNEQLASQIVQMLLKSVQKLPAEQAQPFFKLLSFLTDVGENGLPGLPSFIGLILPGIWESLACNPAVTLDWLSTQVTRNKQAHQAVRENMDKWVERFLIADNSPRVRAGASYLLVCLVPNNQFPQAFRAHRMFAAAQKEFKMSAEANTILHEIFKFLLDMLTSLKKYCDKQQAGTTKLVNYFTLLNYFCLSEDEKAIFTPYSGALWDIYHPLMSEPDIPVHFNKQALLMFWYHACEGCEANIKFITETEDVASNIAYNYILSNDDQEVISFNNATLPLYYGLLRLAASYSTEFCKSLSVHPNISWAFEHLIPRANHYAQTVDELLQLIRLFSGSNYTSKEDIAFSIKFRRKSIELFCGCMDGGHAWTTLVNILKLLIESEEDCIHVASSNGLNSLGEAFSTLHLMYHEATACNVTPDIIEVVNLMHTVVGCCHNNSENSTKACKALEEWKDRVDIMQKSLSLLNSFVSPEIHKACLEFLTIMLQTYPENCIEACAPIIHQSHMAIRMNQNPAPVGPFFPKTISQQKTNNRKLSRSNCSELNMTLHPNVVDPNKLRDKDFLNDLIEYYERYHVFVDKMCRYGLNLDPVPSIITELSCMLAVEVLPLKLSLFPKLWQEVWSKSNENPKYRKCIQNLLLTESFIEFLDTLFLDERELLHNVVFYSFVCHFYTKVYTKVLQEQRQNVVDTIEAAIQADAEKIESLSNNEFEEICPRLHGDMRALCLLLSVPNELTASESLDTSVELIINKSNQLRMEEAQGLLKRELEQRRRKEELEREQHKKELAERKRSNEMKKLSEEGSKDEVDDKKKYDDNDGDEEQKEESESTEVIEESKEESSSSNEEPPLKKKKKSLSPTIVRSESQLKSPPSEEIEMKPGPSHESDGDATATDDISDESSNISSDDFSSTESSEESSPHEKSPKKEPKIKPIIRNVMTTAFRKTCESLKSFLGRMRRKDLESNNQNSDGDRSNKASTSSDV